MIHACCGETSVRQAEIVGNSGNSYIGISQVPRIRDVRIVGNKLLSNVKGDWPLIYVNADTEQKINWMQNAIVEIIRLREVCWQSRVREEREMRLEITAVLMLVRLNILVTLRLVTIRAL